MLLLLTGPYGVLEAWSALARRRFDPSGAAAIGLGLLFAFTAVGHFIRTEPMAQMLPGWVPGRVALVYATGILEFAIAIGFLVPHSRRMAGWVAAAALISFLPVNIYAAFNRIPMGGHAWGPIYLLIRVPLQAIILIWIYWFTLKTPAAAEREG